MRPRLHVGPWPEDPETPIHGHGKNFQSFVVNDANSSPIRQPILVALEVKTTKRSQRCGQTHGSAKSNAHRDQTACRKPRKRWATATAGVSLLHRHGRGDGGGDCREQTLGAGPCAIGQGEIAWDGGDPGGGGSEG